MGKDSLQPTWVKKLSSIIMSMDTDSKGNVWVGSTTGTLTKFNGNGVASSPIKLDNPVYSVTVDKSTDDVYVGDSANNVYKYSSSGTLKWGKNLGVGNQAKVPIVSTINGTDPDERGNFDLTSIYYSQKQIEEMLAPLGKTKSVNGVKPDDAGNVVLDFSNYFTFKGTIDDKANLDKTTDTGWYIKHNSNGQNSTFLVFSDNGSTMQIECGYDNSIKERSSNGNKFTDWTSLTNNIKTINGIKPDSEGNVKLDLTGNIKSVNNVKPDKDGNIQLGAGTKNSIKSINTVNKPDELGNVLVPTFAPNLLQGTTIKKQSIPVNKDATASNMIASSSIASDFGYPALGATVKDGGETSSGEKLLSDIAIKGGENYTYRVKASTTTDTLQLPGWSEYTQWRRADTAVYLTFKDKDDNLINADRQEIRYAFQPQNREETYTFTDTFTAPASAVSFSLWYNGLEQTADNLVVDAYMVSSNSYAQFKDDRTFNIINPVSTDTRIVARIECQVDNYKSGNFLTIKTKDLANHDFNIDNSKLDSNKTMIAPIDSIDKQNLVEQDGFYTWDFIFNAGDIVGLVDKGQVTISTNVVGTFKYVLKLATWEAGTPKPDMEFVTTYSSNKKQNTTESCDTNYNVIKFWDGALYNNKTVNRVALGTYNLDNDYIALDDTIGKYSASAHVDMGNSQGYANLVLMEMSGNWVVNKAISESIPLKRLSEDGSVTKDASNTLKTDSIIVSEPKDNYVIKLYLDIYGQTDVVNVSQQKLAQWKNNDETPPDLTWFPSVQDVTNSLLSLSQGNTTKDFAGVTVNPDSLVDTGTYRFSSCTISAKYGADGTSTFSGNQWGWLINLNYENDPNSNAIYQILILNEVVYYRVISVKASSYPAFRTFAYDTDLKSLSDTIHKEIVGLDAFNANYGNNIYNTTIDLDSFSTNGLSKFLNCSITTKGKLDGHDISATGLYGWIANIPIWNGAEEVQQIVYIRNYGAGNLLCIRDRVHVGDTTDFERFLTDDMVSGLQNPIIVDNKTNPDSLTEPGVYYSDNGFGFTSGSVPENYRTDGKSYLFVLKGENPGYSLNYYQQFLFQATKFSYETWYRAGYKYGTASFYTVAFTRLLSIDDINKLKNLSTLSNPIMVDNRIYQSLDDIKNPGVYSYIPDYDKNNYNIIKGTPGDEELGKVDAEWVYTAPWVMYVYYDGVGGAVGHNRVEQVLLQNGYIWSRSYEKSLLPTLKYPWFRTYKDDFDDLNNKIADLNDKFPISILEQKGNAAVIESSINNIGKIVYW